MDYERNALEIYQNRESAKLAIPLLLWCDLCMKVTKRKALIALGLALYTYIAVTAGYNIRLQEGSPEAVKSASETVQPASINAPSLQTRLFQLVNEERAKAGVTPLTRDLRLEGTAQQKASDMDIKGYFGHTSPYTGKRGISVVHDLYPALCRSASENIYRADGALDARAAMKALMASPLHRKAILKPEHTLMGVGVSGANVTQHFCEPF